MSDDFNLAAETASISALLHSADGEFELTGKLAKLRRQQEKAARAVQKYGAQLDSLYGDISRSGHTADWILKAAAIARGRELTERERCGPELSSLRHKLLKRPDLDASEARKLLEKSIAIGEAWIELPSRLHKKLLALADERRALAAKVRLAQPMQGEMQSTELTRKIIARFPNILAELAK